MPNRILIVEDEPDILALLTFNLEAQGYQVLTATDGKEGYHKASTGNIDLLLLDLMLPKMHGIHVCQKLRSQPQTLKLPIIMLSALGDEEDIVKGLDTGADDYISKPFQVKILLARIRRLLKSKAKSTSPKIILGPLQLDTDKHKFLLDDTEIELTSSEFKGLLYFMQSPGQVFTRNQIMSAVHGEDYLVSARAIDVLIVNLRKKLGRVGEWVQTVRGVGYRFKDNIL